MFSRNHLIAAVFIAMVSIPLYSGEQSTPYVLTDFPMAALQADTAVWVKWTGASRDPLDPDLVPDSGRIYYGTDPGGSDISNYSDSVTAFTYDTSDPDHYVVSGNDTTYIPQTNVIIRDENGDRTSPPKRGTYFRPADQENMDVGRFYYMVAWETAINGMDTTFYSNELEMIVETDKAPVPLSPGAGDTITELTPEFTWENNPGVPYYHIILSDERISVGSGDTLNIEGLSVVWQAITSKTEITYGTPDPSGTLPADPPPISPGENYSWVVLNNYGNHVAYTSSKFGLPRSFTVKGDTIAPPENYLPADSSEMDGDSTITFKWSHDPDDSVVNTYKVYVYAASEVEGVEAQVAVWQDEVSAGQFSGDTASLSMNARDNLSNNSYTWKVFAVDSRGAGKAGALSRFKYSIPTGDLVVRTKEEISVGDGEIIVQDVSLAKIELISKGGSMEAPLLYYTDDNGYMSRERVAGTYELTAKKDGFLDKTKTVDVAADSTSEVTIYMERPEATMYGKVLDKESQEGIDLVSVYAVSDEGDTAETETNSNGSFSISCYEADWSLWAEREGYQASSPVEYSLSADENRSVSDIELERNPYSVYGYVRNTKGEGVLGASVELYYNGELHSRIQSTPESGEYSFSVKAGDYYIKASKPGFVETGDSIEVFRSVSKNLELADNAAVITGYIYSRSWSNGQEVFAPLTDVGVEIVNLSDSSAIEVRSGEPYGKFSVSVSGGNTYSVNVKPANYVVTDKVPEIQAESGYTYEVYDTVNAYASVSGDVYDKSGDPLGDISVSLLDINTSEEAADGESDAAGEFSLSGIEDGIYLVNSGGEGYIQDTVKQHSGSGGSIVNDTLMIENGRPVFSGEWLSGLSIEMEPGTQSLRWIVTDARGDSVNAEVKIGSPLSARLASGEILTGIGVGDYDMKVDADADSIVDIARYRFSHTDPSDTVVTDTVAMELIHEYSDTLSAEAGVVNLRYKYDKGGAALDSGYLYYRESGAGSFDSVELPTPALIDGKNRYDISVNTGKDGISIVYYLRAWAGEVKFGYEEESRSAYIEPDLETISKMDLSPSGDTLRIASGYKADFRLSGYYSSNYIESRIFNSDNAGWELVNKNGASLSSNGLTASVEAPSSPEAGVTTVLKAYFKPANGLVISENTRDTVFAYIEFLPDRLDSIVIRRSGESGYITSSAGSRAEFAAYGLTPSGQEVTVSPEWSVSPESAGTMDKMTGVFTPARSFAGFASVSASTESKVAYFNKRTGDYRYQSGLEVRYIVPGTEDTLTDGGNCRVVFPDSCVKEGNSAEISVKNPVLTNKNSRAGKGFSVLGKAYDIDELNSASWSFGNGDSITIELDIPESFRKGKEEKDYRLSMGLWNTDSLKWDILKNSEIDYEKNVVRVNTRHFSRYAILNQPEELSCEFTISPNPFSPYVYPVDDLGRKMSNTGTVFNVRVVSPNSTQGMDASLKIYNVRGERVWSAHFSPSSNLDYRVWWDGRTNDENDPDFNLNVESLRQDDTPIYVRGDKMCRNGRYFAVLTAKDSDDTEKIMRQVILFK